VPVLHLGVIDIPYVDAKGKARPHKRHRQKYENKTTGDVAEILEAKYHVMEHFYELHHAEVDHLLFESFEGAIESLLAGAPPTLSVAGTATSKIEDAFKQMLSTMELDALGYPGIPTQAALDGVSHRFANPTHRRVKGAGLVRRAPRPSFIDTGLYQASFKAWVTE